MAKKGQVPAEPDREPRAQSAALPWRRNEAGLIEVLLITSRETRRWVIPKGWPIKGLTSPQTAAREAFEEAGVEGEVTMKKIGIFHYDKRLRSGRMQRVRVGVYPLKVDTERQAWPEVQQREKLWTTTQAAADLVQEPELSLILRTFSPK
ncbi:NUDIX hydrolase [Phenylobacterium sp. LjRoot225]|uniref:NUDIX hydrolase n=1 Tax=Phenylobacterium sp. LjRoot225 TaxID=3342285 RepID=UPI003ECCD521